MGEAGGEVGACEWIGRSRAQEPTRGAAAREEMRCGVWLAAALALCGVRGESAEQDEEEQELLRALEGGRDVFQAYKVIGSAEWEVHNQTLVPLRVEDAMELIESDGSRAPAVADKYRGAVVFVSRAVVLMFSNDNYLMLWCAISSTLVIAAENFYGATVGT